MIAYSFHSLDVSLVAFFLLGLFLFLSADNLSKNTMLYYGSGIGKFTMMRESGEIAACLLHVKLAMSIVDHLLLLAFLYEYGWKFEF